MENRTFVRRALGGIALLIALPAPTIAQDQSWCDDNDRERRRACEVREFALPANGSLSVDARPNGGIEVMAWNRNEVRVLAKVTARADDRADAQDIVDDVDISTRGTIEADGPRTRRGESWWVSYRIQVPADYDLDLESTNGGIHVEGVNGRLVLETTNGGIDLVEVAGDVRARTTNGGLDVALTGSRWQGAGLDAQTTNGGITLSIPEGYSADLETGTRNGGFDIEFPITVSGRIGRTLSTSLGSGGPPIRVTTTNGGVRVRRAS